MFTVPLFAKTTSLNRGTIHFLLIFRGFLNFSREIDVPASMIKSYQHFVFLVFWTFTFLTSAGQQTVAEQEQLLQTAVQAKDNGKASFYAYELGKRYVEEQKADKASAYLTQSISYAKKSGDKVLLYLGYDRMGQLQSSQKKYEKALENYQSALEVAQEQKKSEYIFDALMNVSLTYGALAKYKKAVDPLEQGLVIALRESDALKQQRCYELLSDYYLRLGKTDKVNEYKELNNKLIQRQQQELEKQKQKETLESQVKEKDVAQKTASAQLEKQALRLHNAEDSLLATRYSLKATESSLEDARVMNEKRQLEIDLLNKDKALSELRLQEQETRLQNEALIRNSIIVGTVLLAALVLVMVYSYRRTVATNKKIDRQNKNIKSSINYAQRIQEAMLHKSDLQKKLISDSFILLKPRDIVSGDFYWLSEIKSWYSPDVIIAAADCTGHGVPGAFMSMIGMNALNGIVGAGIAEADQILQSLDREIRAALQQDKTGNNDGMDIALCIYRKEKSILEFAGAKNPLVYIQDGKLTQIKGDVHPIGGSKRNHEFTYRKHHVPIEETTMVYLFSDGYRDQFGGKDGTKFLTKNFNKLLLEIHQKPMEEQKKILDQRIEEWKSGHAQTDDILVIGFKLEPGGIN